MSVRVVVQESRLYDHFVECTLGGEEVVEERAHRVARRLLQGGAVVVGVGGKYPFVASSLEYGGSNRAYGVTLAVASVVAWSVFSSHCLLSIVGAEMHPLSEHEREMGRMQRSKVRLVELVTLFGVAVSSQFPLAYLCYDNNGDSWFAATVTMIDSASAFYSLVESARLFREHWLVACCDEEARRVSRSMFRARDRLIARIEEFRGTGLIGYLEEGKGLQLMASIDELLGADRFWEQIEGMSGAKVRPPWWAQGVGALFSVSQLAMYERLTYYGMKAAGASEGGRIAAGVWVVSINAYLMGDFLMRSFYNQCKKVKALFMGKVQPTLASICYPKMRRVLSLVDLGCSAMSYGVAALTAERYFPKEVSEVQKWVSAVSTFFLLTHLLEPTFDALAIRLALRKKPKVEVAGDDVLMDGGSDHSLVGESKEKKVLKFYQRLEQFKYALKDASPLEISRFLERLPESLKDALLGVERADVEKSPA